MKIYKTQAEVDADIVDDILTIQGDVDFQFNLKIEASIVVKAGNIKARDIKAGNIEAGNIEAGNIKAGNIEAGNIEAWDISFYGVCWTYYSLVCKSIEGRRDKSRYFCLDKEVEIRPDAIEPEATEMTVAEISKALGKTIKIIE